MPLPSMPFIHALPCTSVDILLRARLRFDKHNSDLLTDVHAYNECIRLRSDNGPQSAFRSFCEEVRVALQLGARGKCLIFF